jgi:hypothetical protein
MMKKLFFLISLCQMMINTSYGQTNQQDLKTCGNPRIDTMAEKLANHYLAANRGNSPLFVNRLFRVYFYIVADDNGSNAAATPAQVLSEYQQLVADFAPNNWCFAYMGLRFINSTNINNNINCDVPASYAALNPWLVPNCITIFYQRTLLANSGGVYGGNAYVIPNTFCSIATGNIGVARTISHEVGHCLGLRHTFEAISGLENINGNNCGTAGDLVCDTPADPFGRGACFSNNGCAYNGNCVDGNGANNFSPPYNNIMSYWGTNAGCNVNQFTSGQYVRSNGIVSTNTGLQATLSQTSSLLYGPATLSNVYAMITSIGQVSTTGNVFCQNNCVVGFSGQRIVLNPGFRATPTTGKVEVRPAACIF